MNKVAFFKKTVKELIPKLNIKDEIIVRRDNRLGGYCACITLYLYCDTQEPVYLMTYNANKLKIMPKSEIVNLALHELGHVKFDHERDNNKSKVQMEYEAEKFAIKNIKKYYPKYEKNLIKKLRRSKDRCKIYREAFTKLAEELDA